MAKKNGSWEICYGLHVDGCATGIELIGRNKTDAYTMLDDQWRLHSSGGLPAPSRRRCKLVEIDRVRWGNP